ncbi:MAG: hypothetical protein DHS20C18_10880 [Saprospiraceae bacterium]|nr:MAG: hypothetical protein DHS20C18_10880 [Saprospiraceae bacterium]
MRVLLTIIFLFFELVVYPKDATFPLEKGNTWAVVIGISDYQDKEISKLSYAHRDAEFFADFLKSESGGLLTDQQLRLLTNKNATLARIQAALEWLAVNAIQGDQAILYFAGHGDVETKNEAEKGYLLAYDTPKNNYRLNAIDLDYLNKHINNLSSQGVKVIVITDACHSGTLAGEGVGGRESTARELMKRFANEVKILSCQPYELSKEGKDWGDGRGVFSYYLIDGLKGRADEDGNLIVDLYELEYFLQERVRAATKKMQHPDVFGGMKKEALFKVDKATVAELKTLVKSELQQDFEKDILTKLATRGGYINYVRFIDALDRGKLVSPEDKSAIFYYKKLRSDTTFLPLRGIMDERLTIALMDSVQQAIMAYLNTDPQELAQRAQFDKKYRLFPEYLRRAAEILGPEDPRYEQTLAKQFYFEGLVLRLEAEQLGGDDSLFYRALESQEKALEKEQNAAYIYNELGFLLLELGDFEQGLVYLQKAVALSPTWAIPYNNLAIGYKQHAYNLEEAKKNYQKAIALKPDFSSAYANLGNLFAEQEQPDSAEIMYLKAIVLGPGYKENYFNLGLLLSWLEGREAEAAENYRKALKIDPNYPEAYFELGNWYDEMEQADSTEIMYQKALELKRDYTEAYDNLGRFYHLQGRLPEAEKMYINAIQSDAFFDPAYEKLGYLYAQPGQWKKKLQMASLNNQEKIQVLYKIGITFYGSESFKESLAAFRMAISLDRTKASSYYWLCTYYVLHEQEREALRSLKKTLKKAKLAGEDYFELISNDADMEPLRQLKEYKKMMKGFFPERF